MQVLATVEQLQSNFRDPSSSSSSSNHDDSSDFSEAMEDFIYDPLTKEIIVDPVKGSDGFTYDRWTIINKDLVVSPFTREPLSIVSDDINLRRWLFAKLHAQNLAERFLGLREEYRITTLDLVREVGAGSSFTPQPDDMEVVKANSSVGSNTVAAGESILSPKFDNTVHKIDHSSQRGPEARSEPSLGSRLTSWPLEGWAKSDSSFDSRSLTVKEERVSPRPSMTAAVQPDPLPSVDGDAGREAVRGPSLSLWHANYQKSSSFSRTEMASAGHGEPTFSSQSDVVLSELEGWADFDSSGDEAWRQDRAFTLQELKVVTNNYTKIIGVGAFGRVYYGKLPNGTEVAVKVSSEPSNHGPTEFSNQAATLSRVHHRNLVSLLGYCQEGKTRVLLYEFMSKGTLREHLYGRELKGRFGWKERLRSALNAAKGLEYLHNGCIPEIIHRDISSANILLNEKLRAKVAGFGLSILTPPEGDSMSDIDDGPIVGPLGYLDPEYYTDNKLTKKCDVYSFGVVLLEIICGRPPTQTGGYDTHLVEWARGHLSSYDLESIYRPFYQRHVQSGVNVEGGGDCTGLRSPLRYQQAGYEPGGKGTGRGR
ncbi:hypothetical protein R1sor_000525 [Riccia sorocarpa]|uniref:Protein kinase domain-containing protein n=1 Tax=Riccia sorocarpa TaxID=122646 RepID=A0ABD3GTD6_9MARC